MHSYSSAEINTPRLGIPLGRCPRAWKVLDAQVVPNALAGSVGKSRTSPDQSKEVRVSRRPSKEATSELGVLEPGPSRRHSKGVSLFSVKASAGRLVTPV